MSKRKQNEDIGEDESNEETPALVDVDSDFFGLNADADYHALNRLLIQLFGADSEALRTGKIGDLALSEDQSLKNLMEYTFSKTSADPSFHSTLSSLLAPKTQVQDQAQPHVGVILCERLINMPVQVIPPMYRMLVEEMQDAIADGDPYEFSHYLFVSRVYRLTAEEEEAMAAAQRNSKRHKPSGNSDLCQSRDGVYSFHPEDEEILKVGEYSFQSNITSLCTGRHTRTDLLAYQCATT
ncbi:hypothetical protein ID866_8962 [Astraeus odoratus]|nr:hypothetical protein ID866_8962 [Astraeus odoratus]